MSTFANIYVGSQPNDGTGTPLRSAFQLINSNFDSIAAAAAETITSAAVNSVAGRQGNILLSVNDVYGAASVAYVNESVQQSGISYTMGNSANWTTPVSTVGQALDQLAQRLAAGGL